MKTSRLEAFSDGVIAIIITIMVLELKVPDTTSWPALYSLLPKFICYILSFIYVGIYWNNHHHMLHYCTNVNGRIMWSNLFSYSGYPSCLLLLPGWENTTLIKTQPLPTAFFLFLLLQVILYCLIRY